MLDSGVTVALAMEPVAHACHLQHVMAIAHNCDGIACHDRRSEVSRVIVEHGRPTLGPDALTLMVDDGHHVSAAGPMLFGVLGKLRPVNHDVHGYFRNVIPLLEYNVLHAVMPVMRVGANLMPRHVALFSLERQNFVVSV